MADAGESATVGQSGPTDPQDSALTDQYEDFFQIALDRAIDLAGNLAGVILARPAVSLGVVAAGVGALVGLRLATRKRRPQERIGRAVERQGRGVEQGARMAREGGKRLR